MLTSLTNCIVCVSDGFQPSRRDAIKYSVQFSLITIAFESSEIVTVKPASPLPSPFLPTRLDVAFCHKPKQRLSLLGKRYRILNRIRRILQVDTYQAPFAVFHSSPECREVGHHRVKLPSDRISHSRRRQRQRSRHGRTKPPNH